jgi:hypothetical protein
MTRWMKELILTAIAMSLLMTMLQTDNLFYYAREYSLFKFFIFGSIPVIGFWIIRVVRHYRLRRGIFYYGIQKFKTLAIPKKAKYAIVIAFIGNLIAIAWGTQCYPFYDVGMFRYPVDFEKRDKTFYELKYYYWQQDQYKILELRKECSFLSEHFGLGYSNDIAYGTAYFHKGEKENFEFLSRLMKEKGVDTLWVGVHSVNFETHSVAFDPDLCHALVINQRPDLYYGPLYIPDYQKEKCDAH